MPAVKNVGEPCAGEAHARFDAAAGGNQTSRLRRAALAPPADPTLTLLRCASSSFRVRFAGCPRRRRHSAYVGALLPPCAIAEYAERSRDRGRGGGDEPKHRHNSNGRSPIPLATAERSMRKPSRRWHQRLLLVRSGSDGTTASPAERPYGSPARRTGVHCRITA